MASESHNMEPEDAAARRAVAPVTVYTLDQLPPNDSAFYGNLRDGMTLIDSVTVPPRDALSPGNHGDPDFAHDRADHHRGYGAVLFLL